MSMREHKAGPKIAVTPTLAHTYIPFSPQPPDLTEVDVHIKRADGSVLGETGPRCAPWLLRYLAHDYDRGYIGFRWDPELHALEPGLYIAEIQVDCVPCHRFTLAVPYCPQIGGAAKNLNEDEVQ